METVGDFHRIGSYYNLCSLKCTTMLIGQFGEKEAANRVVCSLVPNTQSEAPSVSETNSNDKMMNYIYYIQCNKQVITLLITNHRILYIN